MIDAVEIKKAKTITHDFLTIIVLTEIIFSGYSYFGIFI